MNKPIPGSWEYNFQLQNKRMPNEEDMRNHQWETWFSETYGRPPQQSDWKRMQYQTAVQPPQPTPVKQQLPTFDEFVRVMNVLRGSMRK